MSKDKQIKELQDQVDELYELVNILMENHEVLDEWADGTTEMVMHLLDRDDEVEEELAVHDFRLEDLEELHEHILFPGDE